MKLIYQQCRLATDEVADTICTQIPEDTDSPARAANAGMHA
jgi:hypothetical protein